MDTGLIGLTLSQYHMKEYYIIRINNSGALLDTIGGPYESKDQAELAARVFRDAFIGCVVVRKV